MSVPKGCFFPAASALMIAGCLFPCAFVAFAETKFATTLSGFGDFRPGAPDNANPPDYKTINLGGGWQPHHPACIPYNADGTLLVTHSGRVYSTIDGKQKGVFADNASVHVKQWSNVDPQVMYYTTSTNCTKNTLNGNTVTSTVVFDISSARTYFGLNFESFWGGRVEGSFIVGEDKAIAIFGLVENTAHLLVWQINAGWLPDHYSMPWNDFDLYCATPISDAKIADNIGYVYVKPIPQTDTNNHLVPWAIVTITSSGASSMKRAKKVGCHHASQCVWQDSDGSFNPGLVDIFGTVFQPDGGSFSVPNDWDARLHIGWIRGTIYACGESGGGATAVALRKTNQGGYSIAASGTTTGGDLDLINVYSLNGIVNCNYKTPSSSAVTMRIIQAQRTGVSTNELTASRQTAKRRVTHRALVTCFSRTDKAIRIVANGKTVTPDGRDITNGTIFWR